MKVLSVMILVIMLSILFQTAGRAEVVDKIVAIVNDDIITLSEVQKYVTIEKEGRFSSVDEYMRDLQLKDKIDVFIEGTLIRQQAKKLKLEVSDKEIVAIIDNIKKQNLITDNDLKQQLKKEGITFKDFQDGIRTSLLRSRVLARVVSPDLNITEKGVEQYYETHRDDYREDEYRLQHLFVAGQRPDAAARANAAYKLLTEGKPFEEVAKEYSDDPSAPQGGDIGTVKKDELIPQLREGIKLLVPGTYSTVIRTSYGYHVIKLIAVTKGESAPFQEVKDKIRDRMIQVESDKRYKEYVRKLRASSYIEVKM